MTNMLHHRDTCITVLFIAVIIGIIMINQKVSATCSTTVEIISANESSLAGYSLYPLDATYSTTVSFSDAQYACYFEISGSAFRLKKTFDLENFTSCVDGSIMTNPTPTSYIQCSVPCTSGGAKQFYIKLNGINEFAPLFKQSVYTVNVSETEPVGYIIQNFKNEVSDPDYTNPAITTFLFGIVNGSNNVFTMFLDGSTSGIVRLNETLDYDNGMRRYEIKIEAKELDPGPTGYATLIVNVIDADDQTPKFSKNIYEFSIKENDTSILNTLLSATPPIFAYDLDTGINQTINYGIESGNILNSLTFLEIDPTTGQLKIVSLIDREVLNSTQFLVQIKAYQTDKPSVRVAHAILVVTVTDKNDNIPIMSQSTYNVSIVENSPKTTFVVRVTATDADIGANAVLQYRIWDSLGAFDIDATTGVVTVNNSLILDREARPSLQATVWAEETLTTEKYKSSNSTLYVTLIDLNDNSPIFALNEYTFQTDKGVAIRTPIGKVSANDSDSGINSLIKYSLSYATNSGASYFSVDATSGEVKVLSALTATTTTTFLIQITAEDQPSNPSEKRSTSVPVTITITNNATVNTTTSTTTSTTTTSTTTSTTTTTTPTTTTTTTTTSSPITGDIVNSTAQVVQISGFNSTHVTVRIKLTTINSKGNVSESYINNIALWYSYLSNVTTVSPSTNNTTTSTPLSGLYLNSSAQVFSISAHNNTHILVRLKLTSYNATGSVLVTYTDTVVPWSSYLSSTLQPTSASAMSTAEMSWIIVCAILMLALIILTVIIIWCYCKRKQRITVYKGMASMHKIPKANLYQNGNMSNGNTKNIYSINPSIPAENTGSQELLVTGHTNPKLLNGNGISNSGSNIDTEGNPIMVHHSSQRSGNEGASDSSIRRPEGATRGVHLNQAVFPLGRLTTELKGGLHTLPYQSFNYDSPVTETIKNPIWLPTDSDWSAYQVQHDMYTTLQDRVTVDSFL